MSKYMLYPTGFVGSNEVELGIIEANRTDMVMAVGMFKTKLGEEKKQVFCRGTEHLFNKVDSGELNIITATDIMSLAYKHIGPFGPIAWLNRHTDKEYKNSDEVTIYHLEFICETLNKVLKDKPRRLTYQGWNTYFQNSRSKDNTNISKSVVFKQTMVAADMYDVSTEEFVSTWASTQGGRQDMIYALKMMFGKQF